MGFVVGLILSVVGEVVFVPFEGLKPLESTVGLVVILCGFTSTTCN